jgi:hypothetical protein
MYDIIGDIHGHADELHELLDRMGYARRGGAYCHPGRQAVFVGDFIDRGPQIAATLATVRAMVDAGAALAVMGNHELNALAFHTPDSDEPGEFLRRHSEKNIRQHRATLDQLSAAELADALAWFWTLPLWLDLPELRVVHACWDPSRVAALQAGLGGSSRLTPDVLPDACRRGAPLYEPVDVTLKGKEAHLPAGFSYRDKDGHVRDAVRTRWYQPADGHTYGTYALQTDPLECEAPLPPQVIADSLHYPADEKPVFFGHYWLWAPQPAPLAANVACLDYSVAKGGQLCAYRWDGERELDAGKFVTVPAA